MTADQLRNKYLEFFKSKRHRVLDSDSLVPKDDPTVLFTPAGMNQFKKEFLGFNSGFKRATTSQRCLRTDDLDKVGKTAVHHTCFEMLGNFSFGDYFKKEAISWAWEFLTQELRIPKDLLWVSVYQDDDESYDIWKDVIRIPERKIIKLGDKDNFWPAEAKTKGPNGPCGPCSEIFFDFGKDVGCGEVACDPACSCGRFAEIWNLVFTQLNRKESGLLEPLPNKNIDTGMGLERLAAVMQGKHSNFETDLFAPIVKEIMSGSQRIRISEDRALVYAIADHIRAVVFCIYDGVLPSNESRGYIVRKIIRKSVLHLRALGIKQPFLNKLVPVVALVMKESYPELTGRQEDIAQIVLSEEKNFISTLETSESLFKEKFAKQSDAEVIGKLAFTLHDTYGIPLDLTKDWLDKHNLKFSQQAFDKELEEQKNRSKLQSSMKGDVFALKDLDYGTKETKFLGYEDFQTKAKIVKILKSGVEAKKISKGEEAQIVMERSVFYAESGGQEGDKGVLVKGKNIFEVTDTAKIGKIILHIGRVKVGVFKKSDLVSAKIDGERRLAIARNHTATHILQSALRKVLGVHVKQQGSLVAEDRLRFDFTHFKGLDKEELNRVEELVNDNILDNHELQKKEMAVAQARKSGALAFFGEKYEGKVRVVSIGEVSKEFCGGTHLDSTGQIGFFKIVREGSVAQGVRRIEAVTGKEAYKVVKQEEEVISEAASVLNTAEDKVIPELQKKLARIKELEKQLNSVKADTLKSSVDNCINNAENINGINLVVTVAPDANSVRKSVDLIKEKAGSNTIVYCSTANSLDMQIFSAVGITPDLVLKGVDASELIKGIASELGGSGGGRKDFAQAGGKSPEKSESALQKFRNLIRSLKIG
ncbi:MAG: alanine--tRNA ligase [Candidatus Omnitrophica bacterium]|nr:alanine--tRNA ligase [Candidatus Omnitrophota bacterium]